MHRTLISIVGLSAAAVQAAPAARAATGFSSTCTGLTYSEGWVSGNCLTGADSTTTINSGVYLPNKIENHEASLVWQVNGAYANSCKDCLLLNGGATLQCYCYGTFSNENGITTINLEDHISNYHGHLLSNLSGAPTVPSTTSTIAVPSDPQAIGVFSASTSSPCSDAATVSFDEPQTCWFFNYTGTPTPWYGGYFSSNAAWQVTAHAKADCSGDALATWLPSDGETCKQFPQGATAFLATPLFNWG